MPKSSDVCAWSGPCAADPEVFERVSRLLVSDRSLDEILDAILREAVAALSADRGFLALVDHDRGELAVRHTEGSGWDEQKRRMRLKVSEETGKGITSLVAATGKPYRTGNVLDDPHYVPSFDDVRSEIAVPLVDSYSRTRGVINVESVHPDAFDQRLEDVLVAVANLATVAVVLDDHRARESALVEIGKELNAFSETPRLLRKIIEVTGDAMRFEDCSLFLIDYSTGKLMLMASRGSLSEEVGKASYSIGEGLTGWVAEKGHPVRTTDPRGDSRWRGLHMEIPVEEMGAFMAVPIHGRDSVLGVIRVLRRRSPYPWFPNDFTQDDEDMLMIIGSQVGIALENARLVDKLMNAERMAAWGEMSARLAHMMGNRVFAIKGDINELEYVLGSVCSGQAAALELTDSISKGIFRLEEILSEFREFVLATRLAVAEVDINDVTKQAVAEGFPKRSPVKLSMHLTEDLPAIKADANKLRRCFAELIENSLHYLGDAGELKISTALAESRDIRSRVRRPRGKYVKISFEDTGPGVPAGKKTEIFRPFYTTRAQGMGLGLSIVKQIVEAHKGVIYECGKRGKGANFVILLPISPRSQGD